MSRVVFVNRFYWPDHTATGQLLTDLARGLAARGFDVSVITSAPPTLGTGETFDRGVAVLRVRSARAAGNSILRKAVAFGTFFVGALWRIWQVLRKGDTLVVMTDPPLLAIPATLLARTRRARVVQWVQDIYPEVAVAVTGRGVLNLVAPLRNAAWRKASRLVTISGEMADVARRAGVETERVYVVPNWAPDGVEPLASSDPQISALRREWDLEGRFVVAYSGNLGRVHDVDTVLAAAAELRNDTSIRFLFIGGGANHDRLLSEVVRLKLSNVQSKPHQPRERLAAALASGDVHLVTLRPGCERFVFPSKLHGILAVGKPIVFVGPVECEAARFVRDQDVGRAFSNGDHLALADCIRQLSTRADEVQRLGAKALDRAGSWTSQSACQRWAEVLSNMGGDLLPREATSMRQVPQ